MLIEITAGRMVRERLCGEQSHGDGWRKSRTRNVSGYSVCVQYKHHGKLLILGGWRWIDDDVARMGSRAKASSYIRQTAAARNTRLVVVED